MIGYLLKNRNYGYAVLVILWVIASIAGLLLNWVDLFPAFGALALCIGFGVFLTGRYLSGEENRLWDSQLETQLRMIWRYVRRSRREDPTDPLSLEELESRISDSFEGMLASKNAQSDRDSYRVEMGFSILGTLQWGFGEMLMRSLHG
ncbi:MAG: hypothetical protein AAGC92_14345 [Pseudomonadota bacterium]